MPPSPVETGPAHQLEQNGFRLIVLGVPDGNPVGARLGRRPDRRKS